MGVTSSDNGALTVESSGSGPAVVLVHGLGFSARHWRPHVEALVKAGYCAVTYNLRGFGGSDVPEEPYGVKSLAEDLEEVRRRLGLDRFHLVGHSLGGMVALQYAVDHPQRLASLVLASTTSHNGQRASLLGKVMSRLCAEGFDAAMADPDVAADVDTLCSSLAVLLPAIRGPMRQVAERPHRGRALAWQAVMGFSVRDRLAAITCPTWVVHGERDLLIPCVAGALVAQGLPHARWTQIPGAGHNIPLEPSLRFGEQLVNFFEEVERP